MFFIKVYYNMDNEEIDNVNVESNETLVEYSNSHLLTSY